MDELLQQAHQLLAAGQLQQAENLYQTIIGLHPDHADALHGLGLLNYQLGQLDNAINYLKKVVILKPETINPHFELAAAYYDTKQDDAALTLLNTVQSLNPNHLSSYYYQGKIYLRQNKFELATKTYQTIIDKAPNEAPAWLLLGKCQQQNKDFIKAESAINKHLSLLPDELMGHFVLVSIWQEQNDYAKAQHHLLSLISKHPDSAELFYELGHATQLLNQFKDAIKYYQKALAQTNCYQTLKNKCQLNIAHCQLTLADFDNGWQNLRYRFGTNNNADLPGFSQPQWQGENLADKHLLVWAEQGLGDEILFSRYLPNLLSQSKRLSYFGDARLFSIFKRHYPDANYIDNKQAITSTKTDLHCPIFSIPDNLKQNTPEKLAAYIKADLTQYKKLKTKYKQLNPKGKKLVGLSWYSQNTETGARRSLPLASFDNLLLNDACLFMSLQYGYQQQNNSALHVDGDVDALTDLEAFLAQVACMDLVISIDNSTAQFAGALSVPCWVLLPFHAEWRWQHERHDSAWYDSLRVFRQPVPGDWQSVLLDVSKALTKLA